METTAITPTPHPPAPPAPRRSRKRWYLIGGFVLLVLAAPFVCSFAISWWNDRQMEEIYREIEADDPNWRWHDLVAELPTSPAENNSSDQILKIELLLKTTPFDTGPKWRDPKYRNARLAPDQVDVLQKSFDKLDPKIVPEARKLKDMSEGGIAIEDVENPFFQIKLDRVQASRGVMNVLNHDAMLRSQNGDHSGAIESCQALVNTARSMKDQPFLITQLVRFAGHAIAVGAVEQALGQGQADEAGLKRLQSLLELENADDGLRQALRCERAGGHEVYRTLREGKTTYSEMMGTNFGMTIGPGQRLIDVFPGILLNGYPDFLRSMNEQVRACDLQDAERADAMRKIEEKNKKNRSLLTSMMMPASFKVNDASQRTQAWMRCTTVAVAVERHRLAHQNWPRGLDEVVKAGLLRTIPNDPYDGKPLRFLRTPTGVVVYSIGVDLKDDGGRLNRLMPNVPGTDLGVELWDPERRGVAPRAKQGT